MATIRFRRNGPIVVTGPVTVEYPDGRVDVAERLFLCRCGESATKPDCDGAHRSCGFLGDGEEPPMKATPR